MLYMKLMEDGKSVELEIQRDDKAPVYFKDFARRPVRVRVGRPDPKKLIENMQFFASSGLCGGSVVENLNYYIQCRRKEISDQLYAIQQALVRIERNTECIEIAKNAGAYLKDIT